MDLEAAARAAYESTGHIDWETQGDGIKQEWYKQTHAALKSTLEASLELLEAQFEHTQRRNAHLVGDAFPELEPFLDDMRDELRREGRHKGRGWQKDRMDTLAIRMLEESTEVLRAINNGESLSRIVDEAVDVALMAFMVAERADPLRFKPQPKKSAKDMLLELTTKVGG
jgi:NTP pyrophosphatase (non-canonical NTP hydrolase)